MPLISAIKKQRLQILEYAVEALSPQVVSGFGVDQLTSHAHTVA